MKKISKKYALLAFTLLTPSISFAALDGVKGLLKAFSELLNPVITIIFGIALIYFFWGVTQFILNDAGNEKTREDGKKKMIWGVVALFVFVSIYGILRFVGELVDIPVGGSGGSSPTLPAPDEEIII
jgi:hypothetical protein